MEQQRFPVEDGAVTCRPVGDRLEVQAALPGPGEGLYRAYLRGESGDRARQEDWMNLAMSQPDETGYTPVRPAPKKIRQETAAQGTVMDALLTSRQVQESMRGVILETLRSPEGQALIEKAVRKAR